MSQESDADVTLLLQRWSAGDRGALDELMRVVYPELQRIAQRYLSRERTDHTLQCTALVNEAYLRLVAKPGKQWADRSHFFAVASRMIRGILVDYARSRLTQKRGLGVTHLVVDESIAADAQREIDLLDLDRALDALQKLDAEQSQIVEMRFFGGLSLEEVAEVMQVSVSKVKRDWILAKTWLRRQTSGAAKRADEGSRAEE